MLQVHTPRTRFSLSRSCALAVQAMIAGMLLLSASPGRADAARARGPALSPAKDADRKVVDVLEHLGVDLVQGPVAGPSSGAHALVKTEESAMLMHLWVDSGHRSITLVRAADGHLLSREVAPDTFLYAPYAAAVIATELVELMHQAPFKPSVHGQSDMDDLRAQLSTQEEAAQDAMSSLDPTRAQDVTWAATLARRFAWTRETALRTERTRLELCDGHEPLMQPARCTDLTAHT